VDFRKKTRKGKDSTLYWKEMVNRKHGPKAWEQQTEAHAYWRERRDQLWMNW